MRRAILIGVILVTIGVIWYEGTSAPIQRWSSGEVNADRTVTVDQKQLQEEKFPVYFNRNGTERWWRNQIFRDRVNYRKRHHQCYVATRAKGNTSDICKRVMLIVAIVAAMVVSHYCGNRAAALGVVIMSGFPYTSGDINWENPARGYNPGCVTDIGHYDAILTGLVCAIFMAAGICVCLSRQLCRARKYKRTDGVYLQIVTERVSETAHLGECTMPLDQIFQGEGTQPLLMDIRVSTVCGSHVAHLKWGRPLYATEMVTGGRAITMALPECVSVSRQLARALRESQYAVNRPFGGLDGNKLTRRNLQLELVVFIADGIQSSQPIYKTSTLCTARFHGSIECHSSSTPEGH